MRLPARYDAHAIRTHYDGQPTALRKRALYIAGTVSSLLGNLAPEVVWLASGRPGGVDSFWERQSPAIAGAIEQLGPTAIKFGQAAANRPDLVGPRLADELRLLQDSVEPFSRAEAVQIIREDLPADAADEVLAVLPTEPAAAASLGQVYRLEGLPSANGQPVALKLLRPGARELVAEDSVLARKGAAILETLTWNGERLIKPALVDGVDEVRRRPAPSLSRPSLSRLSLFLSLADEANPSYSTLSCRRAQISVQSDTARRTHAPLAPSSHDDTPAPLPSRFAVLRSALRGDGV